MVTVEKNVSAEAFKQKGEHTLFVEGEENSIDPQVISKLLHDIVRVKPLGASPYIKSVADAMYKHHPKYYFLIDRDHYDDAFIEERWSNFPDPNFSNLLVWPRREIENYFIIPDYIKQSEYLSVSFDELENCIIKLCNERIFIDSANLVILDIRENFKQTEIKLFEKKDDFKTNDDAIEKLSGLNSFNKFKDKISEKTSENYLKNKYEEFYNLITGGDGKLEFNTGKWLELIKGKEVLPSVRTTCFNGKAIKEIPQKERLKTVTKDLVTKPIKDQPHDFQRLYELISKQIDR
ncbi:MAG: hypothetical protein HQK88_06445 [Nitrospirae bacterium]|nr:hypothetical protein [Nitrospirota bacterium]MBF0534765.1 hypothetical protein [Nitrospirota bacterium]MBF0616439.1 hypothetical protein [Nitrospirota bacterium]